MDQYLKTASKIPCSASNLIMKGSTKPFLFLDLPAEIRLMVYSHIILPPHRQALQTKTNRCERSDEHCVIFMRCLQADCCTDTAADRQYFEQRRLCHMTAKSLLLVSKAVNIETTQLFYRHKTIALSNLNEPFFTVLQPHKIDTILYRGSSRTLSRTAPQNFIRHIEFNLSVVQSDIDSGFQTLRNYLVLVNSTLRTHITNPCLLARLQTVTIRIVQASTGSSTNSNPWLATATTPTTTTTPFDTTDFDLDAEFISGARPVAHRLPVSKAWIYCLPYHKNLADELIQENGVVFQYGDEVERDILRDNNGWCYQGGVISKSDSRAAQDCWVHEMRFERAACWVDASSLETISVGDEMEIEMKQVDKAIGRLALGRTPLSSSSGIGKSRKRQRCKWHHDMKKKV